MNLYVTQLEHLPLPCLPCLPHHHRHRHEIFFVRVQTWAMQVDEINNQIMTMMIGWMKKKKKIVHSCNPKIHQETFPSTIHHHL